MIEIDEFRHKVHQLNDEIAKTIEQVTEDWSYEYRYHAIGEVAFNLMRATISTIYEMNSKVGEELLNECLEELKTTFHDYSDVDKRKNLN